MSGYGNDPPRPRPTHPPGTGRIRALVGRATPQAATHDAIYRVVHQPSGHVVDTYESEKSALACAERENENHPKGRHVVVRYVRADLAEPAAPQPQPQAAQDYEAMLAKATAAVERVDRAGGWSPEEMAASALGAVGITEAAPQPQTEPVGEWVMVPREPTREMQFKGQHFMGDEAGDVWAAMLAAAPAPRVSADADDVALIDEALSAAGYAKNGIYGEAWQRIKASLGVGK